MKQPLAYFFFSLIVFVGCQGPVTTEDAVSYNDKVNANKEKVVQAILAFNDVEVDSVSMKAGYDALKKGIAEAREGMDNLPSFDGNEDLKMAGLKYMDFFVAAVDNEYLEIRDIMCKKNLSELDGQQIGSILMGLMEREKAEKDAFNKAQGKFARQYGFQEKAVNDETETHNPG